MTVFKLNFYFQACEYLLCNVVAVFITRESKLWRILTTALCALLQCLCTCFYFIIFYRQVCCVIAGSSCHGAQARKLISVQIPQRRILGRTGNLGSHCGCPHRPKWGPSSPLGPRRPAMLLLLPLLLPWLVSLWAQVLVSAMALGWPRLPGAHTCTEVQANCMVSMLTTTHRAWGPMGMLHSPIGLHWTPLYFTK